MKNIKLLAVVAFSAAMFTSCVTLNEPIAATSNPVGHKCGEATNTVVLGLGGSSEQGLNQAAKNGGITKVSHVEYVKKSIFGIIHKYTTRVYGE